MVVGKRPLGFYVMVMVGWRVELQSVEGELKQITQDDKPLVGERQTMVPLVSIECEDYARRLCNHLDGDLQRLWMKSMKSWIARPALGSSPTQIPSSFCESEAICCAPSGIPYRNELQRWIISFIPANLRRGCDIFARKTASDRKYFGEISIFFAFSEKFFGRRGPAHPPPARPQFCSAFSV